MMLKRTGMLLMAMLMAASLCTAAVAGDYVQAEHPSSFRGLAWKTTLADAPGLLAVKGIKDTYFKPDERLRFGDAEIVSVGYYFRKDKLYRVGVAFRGRANHFLIKERLMRMYGRGRGVGSRYGWMWPDFSIEITFDDDSRNGGLFYTYEGPLD